MKKRLLFFVAFLFVSCFLNTQAVAACPKDRPFLVGEPWINKNCRDFNIQLLSELHFLKDPYAINFPISISGLGCKWEDNERLCNKLKDIQNLRDEMLQKRQGKPLTRDETVMLNYRIIDQLISECGDKKDPLCQKLDEIKYTPSIWLEEY